ncbi:MAG TPA: TonB-dependent receptor [Bacteroidota bacterium]|nr:TonB-dependent receptor [Bacteroidota bacterium]
MKRAGVILIVMLSAAGPALRAQEGAPKKDTVYQMSPVVVTATQASERKSPVTFSNLTPLNLRERYSVQDVPVLLAELPSITTYSENGNGIGYNYINLRGFDQRRISVMINGVPQNDPEDHNVYWIDFPDLLSSTDNIQVQRGAGNAFYGPAAIGGSVNLVTNPFGGEPGVTLEMMTGFQEFGDSTKPLALTTRKYGASFTSGLVGGRYMLYGRLGKITSDGYRANSWVDMNSYFFGAIRFDADMSTRFHFFGGPIQDGLAYDGLGKFVNGNRVLRRQNVVAGWTADSAGDAYASVQYRRPQETESFSQPHAELMNDWKISSSLTLHNTLFYYTGSGYFDYDASWADTSMLRIGYRYGIPASANPGNALVRAFVGNSQWGWLPRLEIAHGGGDLTVGAEMRFHRSTHWGKIEYAENLPAGFDPDYHFYEFNGGKDMFSLYGHELLRIGEDMILMADAQLVRNRYTFTREKFLGNSFSVPYLFLNPRLGLNWNINDAWSSYLSFAYTSHEPELTNLYEGEASYYGGTPQFRADTTGGVVTYDFSQPLVHPEELFDGEFGVRAATVNAEGSVTAYWMEFSNELVKSGQVDIFGQPVTGNAKKTRHIGFELEGALHLTGALTVSGNFTASRNRIISATYFPGGIAPVVLDGNPIAGFPDVLGNIRLTWRTDRWTASVMGKYIGAFHTDNFNDEANTTDAAVVFNCEILCRLPEIAGSGLTLRGELRNVFNTLYLAGGEGNTFFPAAERNFLIGLSLHI